MMLNYQLKIDDAKVSLDRLTLIGTASDIFPKVLNKAMYIKDHAPAKIPYRQSYYCTDGSLIQMKDRNETSDNVRIDFNPNKCQKEAMLELLSFVHFTKITRLDIAVDYYGRDLTEVVWVDTKARKRVTYQTGAGKLETLYIGSGGSETSYRIYDKAKEQKSTDNGLWWRVEAQLRPDNLRAWSKQNLLKLKPFGDVQAILPEVTGEISSQQKAMVYWLTHVPTAWGELHSNTRTKYRELINQVCVPLSPQPSEVFKNKVDELREQLAYYTDAMRYLTRIS